MVDFRTLIALLAVSFCSTDLRIRFASNQSCR
ncbi:hypothetical protein LCGC14_2334530, partial [marine sediment metagenome]